MRVRPKNNIFDLGKKMTVDKGAKIYLMCCVKKPFFYEAEKRKRTQGTSVKKKL